jgi:hypothetical protein
MIAGVDFRLFLIVTAKGENRAGRSSLSGTSRQKDRVEWRLRELVCAGQLDVREAQRAIADDWTEVYAASSMSSRQTLG